MWLPDLSLSLSLFMLSLLSRSDHSHNKNDLKDRCCFVLSTFLPLRTKAKDRRPPTTGFLPPKRSLRLTEGWLSWSPSAPVWCACRGAASLVFSGLAVGRGHSGTKTRALDENLASLAALARHPLVSKDPSLTLTSEQLVKPRREGSNQQSSTLLQTVFGQQSHFHQPVLR